MNPIALSQENSRIIHAFGSEMHLHLSSEHTGGAFVMFTEITPPGGGPPPHWHAKEDEWFHVLEGTVSFHLEGTWKDVAAGGSVLAPKGIIHAFKNNTSQPTRMLIHASPGGFDHFFTEASLEFAKEGGPDLERTLQIAAAHGIHFVS